MPMMEHSDQPDLTLTGDWSVTVRGEGGPEPTTVSIEPAVEVAVSAEHYDALPLFDANAAGWKKGLKLKGLTTQETSATGMLDPESLVIAAEPGGAACEPGRDYGVDLDWGTFGRLDGGRIREGQPVYADYRHGLSRIDALVADAEGQVAVRCGTPHVAVPRPPELRDNEAHLANVWVPGRLTALGPDNLFPILEGSYPEAPQATPSAAERLVPRAYQNLASGARLRILAWGDSVTDASYLPQRETDRWQEQFVSRLRERFPGADIELVTEAWGGRNTGAYLAEPPGSEHNYQEKVLDARPDLVVSEFVNDAGLSPEQVEERYGELLADFQGIGAEWIILTPHYVRPDWMGLDRERDIDDDPRPYVAGLREFAVRNEVALADASLRWGRLWRHGLPYTTLLLNAINHPDARGLRLYADGLMALFG